MPTPGQILVNDDQVADPGKIRMNRAGIPVEGEPGFTTLSVPRDSYSGMFSIDSPERVDLVVSRRDKTNISIKYEALD